MLPEWLSLLPPWLLTGVILGSVASCCVAVVFFVGDRLFPTAPVDRSRHIDGTVRRRQEIRQYLVDIDERFREDFTVHGETVAFYLPERDVAITFDAKAYFRIEEAGTYTVLCEHEMPGRGLGRRLPFDVPELEPDLTPDPISTAFAALELDPAASPDEVKSAYRSKIKEAHPDHGGDTEEFQRLQEAYATARDHAAYTEAKADVVTA
ncbi:molecular chaperone DnaJ [Salinigranum rubrum]|uniref:Molecular chaperone DnaJ n=1 Tax=Salinigranum rubrum TaxID=755307 RepID=A0A2I8VGT7_9EURY|nr:J domain-containing protein [Salinigranum rubrum]AUV81146.1 molecular chaperone DnaJ [Salinigranum rubrum]